MTGSAMRFMSLAAGIALCCALPATASPIFDVRPYLHAQRLVDIGGRRMNIYCTGSGSPTVILDAGLGGSTDVWRFVQSSIAKQTRTCSYDRAAMGFSDPANSPRDAAAVVSDLHALLTAAQIAPPYILVGHSIAGLYDRLYADRFRNEIAGMVLVDPVPPDESRTGEGSSYATCAAAAENHQLTPNSTTFKQCGLLTSDELSAKCQTDGPAQCQLDELDNAHASSPFVWKAIASEADSYGRSSTEVVHEERTYGSLPLTVLTRGNTDGPFAEWKVWKFAHEHIAALSTAGKDVLVPGSGHGIQIERPDVVISAVDAVLRQARSQPRNPKSAL